MIIIFLVYFGCQKEAMLLIHQIPWVLTLVKGNLGVPTGQRKFDLGGVWTHDHQNRSTALLTELQGQYLDYPDLLLYWPCSSVVRALVDLFQRSWVQTPPRSNFLWPVGTPYFQHPKYTKKLSFMQKCYHNVNSIDH